MKKYIESIDLLRGICLILMVFINFFDEIAEVALLESKQGYYIDFFVTSLVPNVFMTLMGFLLILSNGYKAKNVIEKAIKILFIGFAVNLIRVPLPQLIVAEYKSPSAPAAWFMAPAKPNLTQRMLNEVSELPATATKDWSRCGRAKAIYASSNEFLGLHRY